jgi:hypothetical protein
MSQEAFVKAGCDLITAVDEAFKKPAPLPAFILLYSSIDILASLTRPITPEDTSGPIFKSWVKKYMIGSGSLAWNEEDIWGARCGLLHTYTIQSRSSRGGTARELHYISDREFAKFVQQQVDPKVQDKVIVCLPDLIMAFIEGVERFTMHVKNDSALQATVFHHAAKLIIHEKKNIG